MINVQFQFAECSPAINDHEGNREHYQFCESNRWLAISWSLMHVILFLQPRYLFTFYNGREKVCVNSKTWVHSHSLPKFSIGNKNISIRQDVGEKFEFDLGALIIYNFCLCMHPFLFQVVVCTMEENWKGSLYTLLLALILLAFESNWLWGSDSWRAYLTVKMDSSLPWAEIEY